MSSYAKAVVSGVAAVLIAGVTAWQSAAASGFRAVDAIPVAAAVAGAVLTYLVPNVPELPWAKAAVSGTLAVLSAMSTVVAGNPAQVSAANLLIAGLSALLVWYVPNLEYAPVGDDGVPSITDAMRELGDELAVPAAPAATVEMAAVPAVPAPVSSEPLPIEAEAAAAAAATVVLPAVTA